jgi:hypothetical protein
MENKLHFASDMDSRIKSQHTGFILMVVLTMVTTIWFGCEKMDYKWNLDRLARMPVVTTNGVSPSSNNQIIVTGTVKWDGDNPIQKRGICYSTATEPDIQDSFVLSGTGNGDFSVLVSNLILGNTYYFRAFATNAVGTSYGREIPYVHSGTVTTIPVVSTGTVSSITSTSAQGGGMVSSNGGSPITNRGICLSTTANPTLSNTIYASGNGNGSFSAALGGLFPGTTYYIRAYATNAVGTAYGNQISFATVASGLSLPVLTTSSATAITSNGASCGGNITSGGGATITQRGVCWSTSQNPTISGNFSNNGSGIGSFSSTLTGLNPNTTYYVRAYATNSVGTAYGNQISFNTLASTITLPVLTTSTASAITNNTATCGGNIISDGGATITQRGVCWSTSQSPTTSDNISINGSGNGGFSSSLTGLNPNTIYYVRAYAINSVGTAYGNQISFGTSSQSAVLVGTNSCSNLSGTTSLYYGMNGTSAPWGINSSGYNGSCWSAPDPNNSGQLGSVIGSNHYIQFIRTFNTQGYMEFWVNTYNPGFNNLIPVIAINGSAIGNATIIGGQSSSLNWMKVRTPQIAAGNNTIRILFSGSYYVLKVDEIEFFE